MRFWRTTRCIELSQIPDQPACFCANCMLPIRGSWLAVCISCLQGRLLLLINFPYCQVVAAASLARVVEQLDTGGKTNVLLRIFFFEAIAAILDNSLSRQYLDNNIG